MSRIYRVTIADVIGNIAHLQRVSGLITPELDRR